MRQLFAACMAALLCLSCSGRREALTVTVANPLPVARAGEMVEIPMSDISSLLQLADTEQIVVLDAAGGEVPCQLTHDEKVIFPVRVDAGATALYTIRQGIPAEVEVTACGRAYPERADDLAWENDLVGFRAYGPALQARGERGFGYDLFAKRGTNQPVLEEMYARELDPESWKKVDELRKSDPKSVRELINTFSYHVDHGYGMDCYAVGPTLGAGAAALLVDSVILYPWCYRNLEILDNGPLRFTASLEFTPLTVKGDSSVVETRLITLDAGSHLNRTVVSYAGLKEAFPVVTGIVLHEPDGAVVADAEAGYITYVDPTTGPDNGKLFVGAAFPGKVNEARTQLFSQEEKKARNNADGHLLAFSDYEPGTDYVYYWGFAWDRADVPTAEAWNQYMAEFAQKIRCPLQVSWK